MIKFRSIKSNSLTKNQIKLICNLKNQAWKYGLDSQLKWFKKNVKIDDFHNLFFSNNKLIAYTLLRKRTVIEKNKKGLYFLFDTIIIDKNYRGKNLSKEIMNFNNGIIKKKKMFAFLVCKKNFVKYYKKYDWKILNKSSYIIKDYFGIKEGLIYNFNKKKNNLIFFMKK